MQALHNTTQLHHSQSHILNDYFTKYLRVCQGKHSFSPAQLTLCIRTYTMNNIKKGCDWNIIARLYYEQDRNLGGGQSDRH